MNALIFSDSLVFTHVRLYIFSLILWLIIFNWFLLRLMTVYSYASRIKEQKCYEHESHMNSSKIWLLSTIIMLVHIMKACVWIILVISSFTALSLSCETNINFVCCISSISVITCLKLNIKGQIYIDELYFHNWSVKQISTCSK